ncbi:MAG: endonuclease domain-containing protein [Clostridia bacterium]|nr:endonuclease domain-containing protein [Clostridia bacterium]
MTAGKRSICVPRNNLPYDHRAASLDHRLRKNMKPQERKLWYLFLRQYPLRFYRQRPIASYIVDFYCASAKLVIEIDGAQHYTDEGYKRDWKRSDALEALGLRILRFTNEEIDRHFDSVCETIQNDIQGNIKEE